MDVGLVRRELVRGCEGWKAMISAVGPELHSNSELWALGMSCFSLGCNNWSEKLWSMWLCEWKIVTVGFWLFFRWIFHMLLFHKHLDRGTMRSPHGSCAVTLEECKE